MEDWGEEKFAEKVGVKSKKWARGEGKVILGAPPPK